MKYIVTVNPILANGEEKEGTCEKTDNGFEALMMYSDAVKSAQSHGLLDHERIRIELSAWSDDEEIEYSIVKREDVTR